MLIPRHRRTDRHPFPHICGAKFFINDVKCPRTFGDFNGSRIFRQNKKKFQFRLRPPFCAALLRPPFCAPLLFMKQALRHYVFTIISTHSNRVLIKPYFTHRFLQAHIPRFSVAFLLVLTEHKLQEPPQ